MFLWLFRFVCVRYVNVTTWQWIATNDNINNSFIQKLQTRYCFSSQSVHYGYTELTVWGIAAWRVGTLGNVIKSLVIVMVVVSVAGQESCVRKVNIKEINKHSITEIYSFRGKCACFFVESNSIVKYLCSYWLIKKMLPKIAKLF